ncbi:MAG: hypothetical protein QG574_3713 [Cyanobacteriota bacterium erpe_2018_sw_21hr_WHONDRS-SW48-000092_B_bin.40]|jgi:hypothetical protein|nr:hypothetical protein [Cyanobacteriota bacterium erpe_2018_sw_21hr_WHONDRS-SW48-000092_B_bin.40]
MASKKRLPLAIALTLALAGMAIYVLDQFDDDSSRGAQAQTADASTSSQPSVLYSIFDPKFNLIAGNYLIPSGWQAQSQVVWNIEHFSQPLQLHSVACSADGKSALEFFPAEQFVWLVPRSMARPGQPLGDGATLLPPVSAQEAMQYFEIAKLRGSAENLKIEQIVPVPELAQRLAIATPAGAMQECVCAKISYVLNGQAIEEEIYGVKTAFNGVPSRSYTAGSMVQYNWGFGTLFSFRAPQGQLDGQRNNFWAMVSSFKPNPAWQAVRAQVQQQALQHNNWRLQETASSIANANKLGQMVVAGNAQFFANQAARREQEYASDQMRLQARSAPSGVGSGMSQTEAFGDLMMGRETAADGSKHDGYHNSIWTDGQGNYRPTNDPNYNPNINSSGSWTQIDKMPLGR